MRLRKRDSGTHRLLCRDSAVRCWRRSSAFVTDLQRDIDGLLLILVCALMGGLFSITLFLLAKNHGWLPHLLRGGYANRLPSKHASTDCWQRAEPAKVKRDVETICYVTIRRTL